MEGVLTKLSIGTPKAVGLAAFAGATILLVLSIGTAAIVGDLPAVTELPLTPVPVNNSQEPPQVGVSTTPPNVMPDSTAGVNQGPTDPPPSSSPPASSDDPWQAHAQEGSAETASDQGGGQGTKEPSAERAPAAGSPAPASNSARSQPWLSASAAPAASKGQDGTVKEPQPWMSNAPAPAGGMNSGPDSSGMVSEHPFLGPVTAAEGPGVANNEVDEGAPPVNASPQGTTPNVSFVLAGLGMFALVMVLRRRAG